MALPLLQQIGQNIVTHNEHISQFPVFLQFCILALVYITKKCMQWDSSQLHKTCSILIIYKLPLPTERVMFADS